MSQRVIASTGLERALREEGYPLPNECGDVFLEMPVDGVFLLHYTVFVTDENLAKLGRALIKLSGVSNA